MFNNTYKLPYKNIRRAFVSGVCAGIAEYFDLPLSIIRLWFIIFAIPYGFAVFVYVILTFILRPKNEQGELHNFKKINIFIITSGLAIIVGLIGLIYITDVLYITYFTRNGTTSAPNFPTLIPYILLSIIYISCIAFAMLTKRIISKRVNSRTSFTKKERILMLFTIIFLIISMISPFLSLISNFQYN